MAIQKQGYNIPFGQGIDTKTDPNQVVAGNMLALQNAVFNKGQLQKRNGFKDLTTLPNSEQTTITTLNGNLLATGSNLYAYSQESNQWYNQGIIQPVNLKVQPLTRNSTSQIGSDAAVSSTGLACIVYEDAATAYYQISDSITGQIIVPRTLLPSTAVNPRCYVLGRYFIITFMQTVAGSPHLRYIAIPQTTPNSPSAPVDISTNVLSINTGYDAYVANNSLFLAWSGSGTTIKLTSLSSTLLINSTHTITGHTADLMSVTADISGSTAVIYATFWDSSSTNGYTLAVNQNLVDVFAPVQTITGLVLTEITSVAANMLCKIFYQVTHDYSYEAVRSDFINKTSITQAGAPGATTVLLRSVGLASKAFTDVSGITYMLVVYGGAFQPSYFLTSEAGNIIMRLAYSNASGYMTTQVLPNVNLNNLPNIQVSYLIKDLLVSVNKTQGASNVAGIYTQTGINLATFQINNSEQYSSEIARTLELTGGMLWQYDAIKPVEQGFQVWPEDVFVTTAASGGFITAQQYFYVFTYEWTDGQGNLHRSAPSIPYAITTGATATNTINVPTLRLTYKTGQNPVRIVGYRWSAAQQNYYQFTSITNPYINDTTVDSIVITDTLADSSILGNTLLYTTGGVIENIAAPANNATTLFRNRLFLIDAEDTNLLWYSKEVIEATPVEMSDLLTMYIAPTAGAQGSTGPITALSSMDDKLIIFKKDAIYYVTGNGPDATGANNDFSEPIFITGTVGCANQKSIVMTPQGLFFQSDKGIWLLGRDLSSQYVGAAVEAYNSQVVKSALSIPNTNEVRITMDSGIVLMYDYYYSQWGTFNGVPAISSTLYNGLHTYLRTDGIIRQQTTDAYLDGANPVLLSFTTSWLKLTGLQGFQRAYHFYFLGMYLTPHRLNVEIAYDFNPAITQTTLISPTNFNPTYGTPTPYGSFNGGPSAVEQWRVFLNKQKCQAFQITITEMYDATFGVIAGAGFTMSGLNLVVGGKATYPKLAASESAD